VTCGSRHALDYVVKDSVSGLTVGALCRFCVLNEFGESLDRGLWKNTNGCAVCERDGHLAIVENRPHFVSDGGRDVVKHEPASEPSMVLCDEHAHGVLQVGNRGHGDRIGRRTDR
jgi:hypothetical protein